jgi:RNA polymerase sigma-70 factor (ECF subfamily)
MPSSSSAGHNPDSGEPHEPADLRDHVLLERIHHSDPEAFAMVVRRHVPTLLRLAQSITGSLESAEDVVQNVLMRLWVRREELDIRSGLRGYLWTAVRNEARQIVRHVKVEERFAVSQQGVGEAQQSAKNTAPEQLAAEDLVTHAHVLLVDLPARCREIFLLSWRDGLTAEEIAAFYEISLRTVQNQIARAVRHLAERLPPGV